MFANSSIALVLGVALAAAASAATTAPPAAAPAETPWVHAIAAFGAPKYPPTFSHFEYVNPDAPKGGTLYLRNPDRRTSFDKFNWFTVKGNAPAGVGIFMLETLTVLSADEPRTMYGLLAESMHLERDGSAITFRLDPRAHFSNGDPLVAEDVKYSFDSQAGPYAAPNYSSNLSGVAQAVVLDPHTIRFELKDRSTDTLFKLGSLQIFSHKWGLKPDGTHTRFDEIVSEIPLTTGPYTIADADSGRRLELKRDPNYWAKDLPARRGMFNFDRIVYRYYQDEEIATEAFKAGEFDLVRVYGARIWVRQHKGAKWDDGRIVKEAFPISTGQGLQAYYFNLRRPLFQDIRVRKAINYTFDYDTNNRYHLFKRANSVFNNSDFAATGLPSPGELKLLEPYRAELPEEVFGPAFIAPGTGGEPQALRRNLLAARSLLQEAGWKLDANGVLRNAQGERFEFEYLAPGDSVNDSRLNSWARNLEKVGITFTVRNVDFALYNRRLEEYDFDMITIVEGAFGIPSAADYITYYGSKSADEKGNNNYRGVKNPAVDHILEAMNHATTLEDFRNACRALDRVVMWNWWQVPELYADFEPMSYWNIFGIPAVRAKYFTADLAPDVDPQLAWPITSWWLKDPSRR